MAEPRVRMLVERLPGTEVVVTTSAAALLASAGPDTLAVVDEAGLAELTQPPACPVLAITDEPLQSVVGRIASQSWLDHVISSTALQNPLAKSHLANLLEAVQT